MTFTAKLIGQGLATVGQCGEPFGAFVRRQHDFYSRAVREANTKVN